MVFKSFRMKLGTVVFFLVGGWGEVVKLCVEVRCEVVFCWCVEVKWGSWMEKLLKKKNVAAHGYTDQQASCRAAWPARHRFLPHHHPPQMTMISNVNQGAFIFFNRLWHLPKIHSLNNYLNLEKIWISFSKVMQVILTYDISFHWFLDKGIIRLMEKILHQVIW